MGIGLLAGLGWAALTIQLYLVLLARWQDQASLLGGLVNLFGYFTVLSNTLVATVLTQAAFGRESAARRWWLSPWVSSGVAVSIVFVALAYSLLLRHLWQPLGMRTGLVVALAIPLVLAMTFAAMYYLGIGLHKISLGALVLALGLLVDDAAKGVDSRPPGFSSL